MHNKVVYHATKAIAEFGLPVLRFNFRGVGLSDGAFDGGVGEQADARAAVDWLEREYTLPILLVGFSFGSYVGMRVCCQDRRVVGLIALGLPIAVDGRNYSYEFLTECQAPKLFVTGQEDAFAPQVEQEAVLKQAPEPKRIVWIDGADHFFQGTLRSPEPKLGLMQQAVRSWLRDLFGLLEAGP